MSTEPYYSSFLELSPKTVGFGDEYWNDTITKRVIDVLSVVFWRLGMSVSIEVGDECAVSSEDDNEAEYIKDVANFVYWHFYECNCDGMKTVLHLEGLKMIPKAT